ncbi:MAG: hypothetical protein AAB601_01135 [Patescibacteria group bacterium]
MKQLIVVLFALTYAGASAQIPFEVKGEVPNILSIFGIGPKIAVGIINDTPLYATVVSSDERNGGIVGDVEPGGTLYERHTPGHDRYPVVVAIVFYDTPARDRIVGIAADVLWVEKGSRSALRTFRLGDIRFLDGNGGAYRDTYPSSPRGKAQEANFPSIAIWPTTITLVANATRFSIEVVTVVGGDRSETILPAGGLKWVVCENINNVFGGRSVELYMTKLGHGYQTGGKIDRSFWPSERYPSAHVFLVGPNDFPRY